MTQEEADRIPADLKVLVGILSVTVTLLPIIAIGMALIFN